MSTRSDPIGLLEPQLQCSTLDWLVYGQPVLALFSKTGSSTYNVFDREYLGQPSRHNPAGYGLKLWVGHDGDTNKLIITLTQQIQVSSGKKPRMFFLCLPVESMTVETADPAYWAMSDGTVPLHALDQPDDIRPDQTSRLLRSSFSLAAKSWVIMPNFPHTGRVSAESMSLLRKLKALSQASNFDLFTAHDSWTHQRLLRVQAILDEPDVTCFNINYTNFYPGGRSAVIDSWESQGWRPLEGEVENGSELEQAGGHRKLKRKHDETSSDVIAEILPPPPYDAPEAASTASFDMAALAKERAESGEDSLLSEIYPRGRSISFPAETRITTLSPNFVFTPVVPCSAVDDLNPSTPMHRDAVLSSPVQSVAPALHDLPPMPGKEISIQEQADMLTHHLSHQMQSICKPPFSLVPETPFSYCLPTDQGTRSTDLLIGQRNVLINWLATLLNRYPYLHYTCTTELLALGLAVKEGDAKVIRRSRAKCLVSVLDYTARHKSLPNEQEHEHEADGSNKIEDLISWLLVLSPEDGDLMFLDRLAEASNAWERIKQLLRHVGGVAATPRSSEGALFDRPGTNHVDDDVSKDDYVRRMDEFMVCKASVVLDACIAFSDLVTDHGIKDRMMEELERSGQNLSLSVYNGLSHK